MDIDVYSLLRLPPIPNKAKAGDPIGGGKVIDAGKYAAFLRNLPFISVPTSGSATAFRCQRIPSGTGKRTSVPCQTGLWHYRNTRVIRTAPEKFIYSGIGDMISRSRHSMTGFRKKKVTAVRNDFGCDDRKKAVNSFVRLPPL